MINANELRIGNYFTHAGVLINATVEDIAKCQRTPALRRPIPITHEILEKCGFVKYEKKIGVCYMKNIAYGVQQVDDNEFHYKLFLTENKGYRISTIKHLHQLQNIYFALTGEELTFNP